MMPLLLGVAAAMILVLGLHGYRLVRTASPVAVSLRTDAVSLAPKRRQSLVGRLLQFLDRVIGGRVLGQMSPASRQKLRNVIAQAGNPQGLTVESLVQRQASFAAIALVPTLLLVLQGRLIAVVLPFVGWFLPRFGLFTAKRRRDQAIERELPDFLDVLAVTISAGLGFRSALRRVATLVGGAVGDEMLIALRQIDVGASRRSAFEEMRERTGAPSLHNFITAFVQAEELGTPLSGFLDSYSKEMRRSAGQRARTAAARANPKISLLLTLMIMPAISLFLVGSLVIMAFMG